MIRRIVDKFDANNIPYAFLKDGENSVNFLIEFSDVSKVSKMMKELGFQKRKSPSKDIYMYGMNKFVYYQKEDFQVIFRFQISCKSSLHGEWIPLDRVINVDALERRTKIGDIYYLDTADYLCFLLADSVYTEGAFDDKRSSLISYLYEKVDKAIFTSKIEKVFFKFSEEIISLIEEHRLEKVISELYKFSDY